MFPFLDHVCLFFVLISLIVAWSLWKSKRHYLKISETEDSQYSVRTDLRRPWNHNGRKSGEAETTSCFRFPQRVMVRSAVSSAGVAPLQWWFWYENAVGAMQENLIQVSYITFNHTCWVMPSEITQIMAIWRCTAPCIISKGMWENLSVSSTCDRNEPHTSAIKTQCKTQEVNNAGPRHVCRYTRPQNLLTKSSALMAQD